MTPEEAKGFAGLWNAHRDEGLGMAEFCEKFPTVHTATIFKWRREAELVLGVRLLSMEASKVQKSRDNARSALRAAIDEVAVPEPAPAPEQAPAPPEDHPAGEVAKLRAENKRLRAESADIAALKLYIGKIDADVTNPPAWLVDAPKPGGLYHGVPTLFLSDLHFGEVVFPAQVNNVNQYNTEIAKARLERVVQGAVKMLRQTLAPGDFGGMVVILGGDMVDGVIHDELRDTADETVMESVVTLHDQLVPALKMLCDEFGKLHVPCVAGNHGRLDRKPRMKQGPKTNFDWILYRFLARTIGQTEYRDRITFQIPDGFDCSYRVHGTTYLLTHGDSFTGGNGICGPILPWMRGHARTLQQYSALGQPYDCLLFGHWHQLRYLDTIIVNGCLPGFNEYALKMRFGFQRPEQALWLTHPKHGRWFQSAVYAEDSAETQEAAWVEVRA